MISVLNHKKRSVAQQILDVQIPAYEMEAKIIGYDEIPPLFDNAETIMCSKETFTGYTMEGRLAGFISYVQSDVEVEIGRLVVHSSFFRRGIASKLLTYVLHKQKKGTRMVVSTGAKNTPVLNLYSSVGFRIYEQKEIAEGIFLSLLEKRL